MSVVVTIRAAPLILRLHLHSLAPPFAHLQIRPQARFGTAYYRAKLSAFESADEAAWSGSVWPTWSNTSLMNEGWEQNRKLASSPVPWALAGDASNRPDLVDESHERMLQRHNNVQEQYITLEAQLREHPDRLLPQPNTLEHNQGDKRHGRRCKPRFPRRKRPTSKTIAGGSRSAFEVNVVELEAGRVGLQWPQRLRANLWAKSMLFRTLTTKGLGELLDSHRDLKTDENRVAPGHAKKTEAASSGKMLQDAILSPSFPASLVIPAIIAAKYIPRPL
ncbi:hypothetical protein B0H17DRAFT_1190813 [Mycena rosella]|uniref:Uncharacterized protein n=1 Tax=Mycena rosella TaxID=1033263 RepID=A0AAD7H1C0_MYCRO|nr:hypothetical protein B0H17DRAFT_1190813 [Mycena rosella]